MQVPPVLTFHWQLGEWRRQVEAHATQSSMFLPVKQGMYSKRLE